ncbi:MAG: phosphate/phosphite/phosphonate ABC transporter substrate-binding protein [Piscirickettsiaceae bacterium CG_4_9_14_3_um_filter_43_564]|uniref:Phosphate-import protein PhnD n=2 Tax=Hydrogenovibrio crunogenus TaxID=39765 RepID=A0A4P7P1Y9_9GAMM|nr:phosphate/phosphite/phosphonate ABC transporter substrate-binding protein [Hydrogenovibrio crunogenus]NCN44250.1 phosphate/phosphite/phosphonate ABC transporter substrate-binding protein [Thiomicrospira sp.]PJA66151.1 MAG: phosphate/phosphite/phosphonate ABC transporter substrate-binding protein [Piscirickettsiaceae bacterium CG_4_9_14_3_um_filter_43_564]MBD3612198.1 phosphate/phosphite/phosphonate ABC transporter substrate-binding protein [Hydrogenovibrio crunogenus]NCN67350.1 phosphate/pho
MKLKNLLLSVVAIATLTPLAAFALPDGSKEHPLRVLMIPTDTGTNDITKDYGPVFQGITENYGIHFDIKAGASYAAVVEGMCNDQADIAWFGAVTYGQANDKCGVDLLAVDVKKGDSSYYSGIFVRKDSGIKTIADLKGKSMAFGSPSSTSSFNFPVAMIIAADVDPVNDLSKVIITGSHSASIAALSEGKVDAAAASYNSFGKAAKKGAIDPALFMPLAKSQPIPNPPLAMNKSLNSKLKAELRKAFGEIHTKIDPSKIRGYGGKKVDRYDTAFDEQKIFDALKKLNAVTHELKGELLEKAGQR